LLIAPIRRDNHYYYITLRESQPYHITLLATQKSSILKSPPRMQVAP
jgi:hypothetical protein